VDNAQAEEFDDMTVEDWLKSKTQNKSVHSLMQSSTRGVFTADAFQLSFLFFRFICTPGGPYKVIAGSPWGFLGFLTHGQSRW
jgi:hypothetical protein